MLNFAIINPIFISPVVPIYMFKNALLIALSILLFSFNISAQLQLIIAEEYDNNRRNWLEINNDQDQIEISKGQYVWQRKIATPKFIWKKFNLDLTKDFSIESTLKASEQNEFGLVWGGLDGDNCYSFSIKKNQFQIAEIRNGQWKYLQKFIIYSATTPKIYDLQIVKSGTKIMYLINKKIVLETPYLGVFGSKIGFSTFGENTIIIANLMIKSLKPELNTDFQIEFSNPTALSYPINTGLDEIAAIITDNDSILYFSRRNATTNLGSLKDDVYSSRHISATLWTTPVNIGAPINNENYNYVCSTVPNTKGLLLANSYAHDTLTSTIQGLSMSMPTATSWTAPLPIFIKNFYSQNAKNDFSLSSNGKAILMAVERKDGIGKNDLYVSLEQLYGWGEPINLGKVINTAKDELCPFLATDLKTLFFSSRGHAGLGEADIFMATRLDESWQKWSTPINLGAPVNSEFFDGYFNFSANSGTAYFVSETDSLHDIFSVALPKDLRIRITKSLQFIDVSSNNNKPILRRIVLKNMLFARGEVQLNIKSYSEIDQLYATLIKSPTMEIVIRGHTDNQGDAESNVRLSLARAEGIKTYLVNKGIITSRINAQGMGGAHPIVSNKSESSRKLNRRVEVLVVAH